MEIGICWVQGWQYSQRRQNLVPSSSVRRSHFVPLGGGQPVRTAVYLHDLVDLAGLLDARDDDDVSELEEVLESDDGVVDHAAVHRFHVDEADFVLAAER